MSWVEILDLSHSALPRSVEAIADSGFLCLVSLRGGINNGAGVQLEGSGAQGTMGRKRRLLQRRAGERRERKCSRKKKGILYRGAAKRRTVGWKKCAADDDHVEQG